MAELLKNRLVTGAIGAGGAFLVLAFLLPEGEPLAYAAVCLAAFCATAKTFAFLYALSYEAPALQESGAFEPNVDLFVIGNEGAHQELDVHYPALHTFAASSGADTVSPEILSGTSPLVAIVRRGELPHKEFVSRLVPYFADASLAFVQAASRSDGVGGIADAYRAQEVLVGMEQPSRARLGSVLLRGSGALIARDALEEAYRPGITWRALGMRLQALGYTAAFEPEPLVLTWAPQTLGEYCRAMLARGMDAWRSLPRALFGRKHLFAARMQYLADALGHAAAGFGALALTWSAAALLYRGVGPFIVSRGFVIMYILFFLCAYLAARQLRALTRGTLTPSLLLIVAGALPAYAALEGARRTRHYVQHIEWQRIFASARRLWSAAIAREDGSGGSAPAGTPARS